MCTSSEISAELFTGQVEGAGGCLSQVCVNRLCTLVCSSKILLRMAGVDV